MTILRLILHSVLVLALACPAGASSPSANAGTQYRAVGAPMDFRSFVENYGRSRRATKLRAERLARKKQFESSKASQQKDASPRGAQAIGGVSAAAGHTGQALVLILILSGVELVHREIEMARLKKSEIDSEQLMELSGKVAEQIVLGGSTWMSLLGGGLTGTAAKKPLLLLETLMRDAETRPIFRNLLQSGIASFITFVGWEMGGQLWEEARELIENDEDYEKAVLLGPLLLGAARSAATGSGVNDDSRLLKIIFSKMADILVSDHELRGLWLYNAWRMRIATGHFATLVGSMVGAGVVGTALFPGAGTLTGLFFGLVGGTFALFIPEHIKDSLTDAFIASRIAIGEGRLGTVREELRSLNRNTREPVYFPDALRDGSYSQQANRNFSLSRAYREGLMTARFEQLFRIYSQIKTLQGNRKVAKAAANEPAILEINRKVESLIQAFKRNLVMASEFYDHQLRLFETLRMNSSIKEIASATLQERDRLTAMSRSMKFLKSTLESGGDDSEVAYLGQVMLTKIYLLGFNETYFEDFGTQPTPERE